MAVSASLVKELRERTGVGMMDCKRALDETLGDIEKAIELLRKSGQAKAAKKSSHVAAEGVVVVLRSSDGKKAVILEVNCQTDFVARDTNFIEFVNTLAQIALNQGLKNSVALSEAKYPNFDGTVADKRNELIAKLGENIQIRRLEYLESAGEIGHYVHGGRIGVLVSLEGGDSDLRKNIAMQVAAHHPMVINPEEVGQDTIEKEKVIFKAQAETSGKPQDIIEKMVEGRIRKFMDEVSLLGQPYVKDPNIKVAQLLQQHQAKVHRFIRFEVGEGIEKEESNFAEEVMAQIKS